MQQWIQTSFSKVTIATELKLVNFYLQRKLPIKSEWINVVLRIIHALLPSLSQEGPVTKTLSIQLEPGPLSPLFHEALTLAFHVCLVLTEASLGKHPGSQFCENSTPLLSNQGPQSSTSDVFFW